MEILIPILDDEICETPEFFTIQIRADKKVGSPSTAMVYIIDNDGGMYLYVIYIYIYITIYIHI